MKNIFEKGEFSGYQIDSFNEAVGAIKTSYYTFVEKKTTIFISHKHDDLEELKGIIGFLEKKYKVKVYIDSQDMSMPKMTSGETARRIKERIKTCEKFILLATDGAIESKWCNWELGFGDAQKYDSKSIALFPLKDKGTYDSVYKGNEYMEIYPHIVYRGGNDKNSSGEKIPDGYYVRYKEKGKYYLKPLEKWLA